MNNFGNRNYKEYELKDHLGNVRVLFSDLKMRTDNTPKFDLDLRAVNNYYPFGMLQPGRYWQSGDYRFGFNGMKKDDEVKCKTSERYNIFFNTL